MKTVIAMALVLLAATAIVIARSIPNGNRIRSKRNERWR